MEEKKIDLNSIIGFILIFGILMWIMYQNQPTEKEKLEQAKKEKIETASQQIVPATATIITASGTTNVVAASNLGSFGYSATLPTAKDGNTVLENDLVILTIANKGGYIVEAKLKKFEKTKRNSGKMVALVEANNASLNLKLQTKDNRNLDTKDLFFEPTLSKTGTANVLTMKLKASPTSFLEYKYTLKPNDYLVGFNVTTSDLKNTLNTSKPVDLQWSMKTYRNEKSISYENRYTEMYFGHDDGKADYLGQSQDKTETPANVNFVALKQHFFTSILVSDKPFATSNLYSSNLVNDEKKDTIFTKQFKADLPLAFENGEINVHSKVNEKDIILKVSDSGIGISTDDQDHLFERFFRAANAVNIQGTGLGLHIVGKYVELMNGQIVCESELEKGTSFIITFKNNLA